MLVRLHTFIRSVLRKNRSAFVPPILITESINQASFDLWRELIQDFRTTGKQSDLLNAFKQSNSSVPTSGVFTVSTKAESVVTGISIFDSDGANPNEYPTRLLSNDSEWVLRKKLPFDDVSESLVKRLTFDITNGNPEYALPSNFMAHKGVIYTSANRKGKVVSSEEFLAQKHPVDQKEIDFQNINEDLIKSASVTITSSGGISTGELPSDYLSNTGVFYTAGNREGKIFSPQDFLNKKNRIVDLSGLEDGFTVKATLGAPSGGTIDLPNDYLTHTRVFYTPVTNKEGKILTPNQFLNKNSRREEVEEREEDFLISTTISSAGGAKTAIPNDYLYNKGIIYSSTGNEGKILSPQNFKNKSFRKDEIEEREEDFLISTTISSAGGAKPAIPNDYLYNKGVIYSSTGNEGKILSPQNFKNKAFRRDEIEEREEDFLLSATLSSASGAKPSLPVDYLYNKGVIYSSTGYEGKILSPQNFKNKASRRDEVEEREEDFIKTITINSSGGAVDLPTDYLYNKGVFYSNINKEGIIFTPENFRNKNIRRDEIEKREEDFLDRITINYITSPVALPEDYLYHKKVFYTTAGAEGVILSSTEFSDRKNSVIFPPDADNPIATIYDNKLEILPQNTNYVFPYICYFNENNPIATVSNDKITILPATSGYSLPYVSYFNENNPIATIVNDTIEILPSAAGYVLTYVSYFNENNPIATIVNDTIEILPSATGYVLPYISYYNTDNPIATIANDTIEILPSATGYVLPYVSYYNADNPIGLIHDDKITILPPDTGYIFPYLSLYNADNPIGRINNNRLEVLPNGSFTYTLPYIAKYTAENPIATIYDNKITVLPQATGYVLPYVAHATERLGFSRTYRYSNELKYEIDPTPVKSKVYYIDPPTTGAATYVYAEGLVAVTLETDLNWDEAAFSNIANRALLYLGSSVGDNTATKIESQVNRNESDIVPRRGRANNPRN